MEREDLAPRSLSRVMGVFEAIAKAPAGMTLAEISVALGAPKSSLLSLLRSLATKGYLTHDGQRYGLGPAMFRLAADILSARQLPKLIRPFLEELLERSQETAILAVIDRNARMVTYAEVLDSPQSVRYTVPAGASRPLYCSSAGRLLLSFQPTAWCDHYLGSTELKPLTDKTVTDVTALRREIDAIRASGVSVTNGEAIPGAGGISAPVFNPDGTVDACVMVAGPSDRMAAQAARFRDLVKDVASRASGRVAPGPERRLAAVAG